MSSSSIKLYEDALVKPGIHCLSVHWYNSERLPGDFPLGSLTKGLRNTRGISSEDALEKGVFGNCTMVPQFKVHKFKLLRF